MTIFGRTISRAVIGAIGIVLIVAMFAFGTSQCTKRRNAASQARVDSAQAGAASNSAADAIATVAKDSEASAASEQLTRDNERDIRSAEGADVRVNPSVHGAGLQALCRRTAYRDAPRCAPFRKEAR